MIRSLTDVLFQITVPVIHVSIDVSVAAQPISVTACLALFWLQMVVAAMTSMSVWLTMEDVVRYVSTNQDPISVPATLGIHLMVTVALVAAYNVQVHRL